jgi:hypothetical protein
VILPFDDTESVVGAGIAQLVYRLGYELEDRGTEVLFLARVRDCSSYRKDRLWGPLISSPLGTGGCFLCSKVVGD